jgi:hypothetical protein
MRLSAILILMATGCGPSVSLEDSDGGGMADTGSSTDAPPPSTSTSASTSTGTSTSTTTTSAATSATIGDDTTGGSESTDEGAIFLIEPDWGTSCLCCDVFAQDCPEGEKCVPWANDGSEQWNGTRCTPIVDDAGGLGDPCTVTDSAASGIDDCGLELVCWNVDPDTLQGTCVAMCTGDEVNPECREGTECLIINDGVLILCLPPCDPLALDACPEGNACVPSQAGFVCAPSAGPVGSGVPCEPAWLPGECGPGSVCAYLGSVPPCDGDLPGCCTSICDLSQPDPCGELGLVCTSWWGDAPVPPGFENVGFCALP